MIKELQGFRNSPAGEIFYIAHPIKISKQSCLECHGLVSNAPQSLIELYGSEKGFGWKLNEIVGAQMVSIPATEIHQRTQQAIQVTMGFMMAVLVTMVCTVGGEPARDQKNPLVPKDFRAPFLFDGINGNVRDDKAATLSSIALPLVSQPKRD